MESAFIMHVSLSPARAYATPYCATAVVIGVPVLSSMFTPATVKTFMGLLLMVRSMHAPYDAPPAPPAGAAC